MSIHVYRIWGSKDNSNSDDKNSNHDNDDAFW